METSWLKISAVVVLIAPGRNRTCNLRIRSPALYPIELRAQKFVTISIITNQRKIVNHQREANTILE